MTDEPPYRDKARAALLATIMIVSAVAMSAAFAGTAAANVQDIGDPGPEYDDPDEFDDAWIGQQITITDLSDGADALGIREGANTVNDGDSVDEVRVENDRAVIDTTDLEERAYHIEVIGNDSDDWHETVFWANTEDLDVEFVVGTVTEGDETNATIDSKRGHQHLNVTSDDLDADALEGLFTEYDDNTSVDDDVLTLENVSESEDFNADFTDVEAGEYELEFETTDSLAADNASITVVDEDATVDFADSSMGEMGDVIDIELELEYAEEGAVQIGEYETDNFQAATGFEVADHTVEKAVIQFNTNAPNESDSWQPHPDYADDVELIDEYANATAFDGPLGTHDYTMMAGTAYNASADDGHAAVEDGTETDTAFFSVTEPTPASDVTTSVAPIGTDLAGYDDLKDATVTDRDMVADGDELLVTVEDFGLSGVLEGLDGGDSIGDELANESIEITLVEQDPGPNVEADTWTTNEAVADAGDDVYHVDANVVYTDLEQYDDDLVLHLEYDGDDPLAVGGYDLLYGVDEDSPFVEDELELATEFEIVEPVVEWDYGVDKVPNAEEAKVSGTTTTAPGSAIGTDARSGGNFSESESTVVAEDGTFTATYDFSEYAAGTPFELTATHSDQLSYDYDDTLEDEVDAVLVDAAKPLIDLETTAPADVEAGDDAALEVTVSNDGGAADDVDVTVTIGGDDVKDGTVTLEAGDEWSDSFDFDTADEADIDWTVTAGDESDSGTLTVKEPVKDDDDRDDDDHDDDTDDDDADETPGLGVGVAVVALLAAAMLALRRQD